MMGILNGWFKKGVAVDLGTANTLIYVENQGIVLSEPSAIAVDSNTELPIAVGTAASAMIGRTPQGIRASRPLKHGVVAELRDATLMLNEFIKRAYQQSSTLRNPEIAIAIPACITSVEKIAIRQIAENAKASRVFMPYESVCAAIGADLPITEPTGSMIVDIGGVTTEVAVLSLCGVVVNESIRVAGDEIDDAIRDYLRNEHNLRIGHGTAEDLKVRLSSAWSNGSDNDSLEVFGLNMFTGVPRTITITRAEVREAIAEPLCEIVGAVKRALEKTPPELISDIQERGIFLVGGGAYLQGLDDLISSETNVPVMVAEEPLSCVAAGAGRLISDPHFNRVRDLCRAA